MNKNEKLPVIVLFGGNPFRREEIIKLIQTLGEIEIYGTLSEEDGMKNIKALTKVDLVLIGGRYSEEQRIRIRKYVADNLPDTLVTEPGWDYAYENEAIIADIKLKLGL